jgi:hypothetical protein
MVKSQSAPRISDVADPAMFLAVSQERWLNYYISPPLTYSRTGSSYDRNYALIAVPVSIIHVTLLLGQPKHFY